MEPSYVLEIENAKESKCQSQGSTGFRIRMAERVGFEPSIQVLARIWRHASRHVVASARLPPGPDWKYFPHPSHPLLILGVASRAAVRRRPLIFTDINSMEIQVARGHAGSLRSPRIFLATPDFAM